MDGFGGFDELMFCVVMCQIRKGYTSTEIHLVDVEMLFFDFRPCTAFGGEVFDEANWNFVLDSLTVGLPNCPKEQHPSFTLTMLLFLQPTSLMSVRHLGFSFRQARCPNK
jgi:hypothetical protein